MASKKESVDYTFASNHKTADGGQDVHESKASNIVEYHQHGSDDSSSDSVKEVFSVEHIDPVLARKMALVNEAIDSIGMTGFQWKMFVLNRFGYAVDSLLIVCQSIANPAVQQEYGLPSKHVSGIPLASQVGLLVGAGVWGFSADIIGRKLAFNTSLLSCAIFVLIAGGMPNYISFSAMVAIYSAGARGNYILDATSFLEFLPTNKAWLVTFMSIWWAVGYTITGLFAWDFMSNYSCDPDATIATCTRADNMGWRYLHFTCGAVVLTMALARLFLIRMVQTPRWLLSQNRDEEVITVLDDIATKYKRTHSLTLNQLQTQGTIVHTEKLVWSSLRIKMHFKRLFQTQKLGWSTTVILANWFVIGMVHQLYSVFLPFYLESRGADTGDNSNYTIWRNYAVNQVAGLIGPAIAAVLVETDFVGRRGTLAIGALITMVLQFRTIYAYTPEILPSAHRATSYGLCVVVNRVGGILGVLVGSYANVETTAPLFVCAALFGLLVVLSLLLPFESKGRRSQ